MDSFADIRRTLFIPETKAGSLSIADPATIMIVDDNSEIIEALSSLLKFRYRIISCLSYEQARQRFCREVNLVLLDIKMARKDGVEAFKLLHHEHEGLPIIFHSAYPGSGERAAALEQLNHSGYLTKGEYDLTTLIATIELALSRPLETRPSQHLPSTNAAQRGFHG
jgi:CheY-like chemotaxis protein